MKRLVNILGVTLLEIMLVLAIAALIIVMSVRYFQSASTSQQATAFLSQLQAIVAAQNSLSQGTGTFVGTSSLTTLLPTNGLVTPWGISMIVTPSTTGGSSFSISGLKTPTGVCTLITSQLLSSAGGGGAWSTDAACSTVTYTLPTT